MNKTSSLLLRSQPLLLSAAAVGICATRTEAQVVFSIDYRGASIGTPATGGGCITAADLLITPGGIAYGPLPAPAIFVSGGFGPPGPGLGLGPFGAACFCPPPGLAACAREVDALSFGNDARIKQTQMTAGTFVFSVDACTMSPGGFLAPNVATEFPVGDSAADVFESLTMPAAPVAPFVLVPGMGNTGIVDGNGFPSGSGAVYPGLGLIEPRFGGAALTGDDVDAIDIGGATTALPFPAYFSLDAGFMNVCVGLPNTGSAAAYGFPPAAVLVTLAPGGPPVIYAPPPLLGLDMFGPGTDDLDALALAENGAGGFQVSPQPYSWVVLGTDMLLFSVRRGSAVVGMPDSIFGAPIEPGDILIPPVAGGVSPFPGIFIAAEALGLATGRGGAPIAAELDALDTVQPSQTGIPYCFGTPTTCPCGNVGAAGNGCANSVNPAGANIAAAGVASVAADTVIVTGSGMPPGSPCLYFQGTAQAPAMPFGDGVLCIGGQLIRLGVKFNNGVGSSTIPSGIDPPLSVMGGVPPFGGFRFYSGWYRDGAVFCTAATFNVTNGVGVLWTP